MRFKNNMRKYIVTTFTTTDNEKEGEEDYVVKSMGAFGVWQAFICFLASTSRLVAILHTTSIVFLTPITHFACVEFENEMTEEAKNSTCYENCVKYEYYSNVFEPNLISDFDLICDRAWLASLAQTVVMFGVVLGINLFGWISDRFGRRPALIACVATSFIFSIAGPFASDYWTFACLRFFIGLGCGGNYTVCVVIIMEFVGPTYRELGGIISVLPDGIYCASLSILAYYASTWKEFFILVDILSFIVLLMVMFVPETPRWLMINRKNEKVVELMTKAAKFNKRSTVDIKENVAKAMKNVEDLQKSGQPKTTFIDLFRTKELIVNTVVSVISWTIVGLSFFGIYQYLTLLGSNIYIVVVIEGLVQIPGTILGMYISKRLGRRIPIFYSYLMTGVVMGILIFLPDSHWASTTLGLIGLSLSSVTFNILYVQANELFPTVLRNMGFGISSAGSKFGGMLAPFIANIEPHWISSLIFAILPFVGAFVSLILPETEGIRLKDTIE